MIPIVKGVKNTWQSLPLLQSYLILVVVAWLFSLLVRLFLVPVCVFLHVPCVQATVDVDVRVADVHMKTRQHLHIVERERGRNGESGTKIEV